MTEQEFDYEALRRDLLNYLDGAFFGGGFGAALIDRSTVESCSNSTLISIARRYGFPIEGYFIQTNGSHFRR